MGKFVMKKIILKSYIFFLGLTLGILLFNLSININAVNYTEKILYNKTIDNNRKIKLDKINYENINGISDTSTHIEVSNKVRELKNNKLDIVFVLKNEYNNTSQKPPRNASLETVNKWIQENWEKQRKYFEKTNKKLFDKINLDIEDVYISQYSPYVFGKIKKEKFVLNTNEYLTLLKTNTNINNVFIKSESKIKEQLNYALPSIDMPKPSNIMTDTGLSGRGVVVGILEAGGIIDENNPNFKERPLVNVRREWYYKETVSKHATAVASIAAGKFGIAKECKLLSVELAGNPISETEWMLKKNVNIINNSWGYDYPSGNYDSTSTYFDYIVHNNWVTIVKSAGNYGNENEPNVSSPGLGYNVVTVGATTSSGHYIADYSSYQENFSISKPTIVAPSGVNFKDNPYGNEYIEGTSFSAPIVTGLIALYMEKYPALKVYPEYVLSLITASATAIDNQFGDEADTSGLRDKTGAGLVNFENFNSTYNNSLCFSNPNNNICKIKEHSMYLNKDQSIRISLAWIISATGSVDTNLVTDYDLFVLDNYGNTVASSCSGGNNIEFIDYKAKTSGTYKIVINQYSSKRIDKTEFLSLSWCCLNSKS